MILIIGPCASGKREYTKSLGYKDKDMSENPNSTAPVIHNIEKIVFENPNNANEILPLLLNKKIVICNEVGSGIIPAAKEERIAREAVGRLCVSLAQQAEKVIRIQCGIPQVIKG